MTSEDDIRGFKLRHIILSSSIQKRLRIEDRWGGQRGVNIVSTLKINNRWSPQNNR